MGKFVLAMHRHAPPADSVRPSADEGRLPDACLEQERFVFY